MSQINYGLRGILSNPLFYSLFQSLMGARKARRNIVDNYICPFSGMKILDLGCGPADILAYLPDVQYFGYDLSEYYINQARKRFGNRGEFYCKQFEFSDLKDLPLFDMVIALGLIHHLDDQVAKCLIRTAFESLKQGGKLLTIDPCFHSSQNYIAKFLIRNDRGQNVRDYAGYEELVKLVCKRPRIEIHHTSWIPYTHCFTLCHKS